MNEWAGMVTLVLFGLAAPAIVILGLVMRRMFYRYPEAYRQAMWQGRLFRFAFLKANSTRPEFVVLVTCFALVTLLFAWVLTAILVGWLKPVVGRG